MFPDRFSTAGRSRHLPAPGQHLGGIIGALPERPKAILIVTAHWETDVSCFVAGAHPGMLYDYYGFPAHTYRLQYPAPGAPALAARPRDLLSAAGIASDADIPVLEMSVCADLDPVRPIAIGRALALLRAEGVLVIGSGLSYHNLRGFMAGPGEVAATWDAWLTNAVTDPDPSSRDASLGAWTQAPHARHAHPREDHLIPLMVVAGAASSDCGVRTFTDHMGNKAVSGFEFG